MSNIVIITDSASDLSLDVMNQNNIKFASMLIELKGESFLDKVDLMPNDFYDKIKKENIMPKTSQPNPGTFERLFREELDKGNKIICITISSNLSGTYNSACIAKDLLESDDIFIIDSKCGSSGEGLIVLEAAKMISEGLEVDDILSNLKTIINNLKTIISVDSIELLKKGGRISNSVAAIGTLLNIKPILTIEDGKVISFGKAKGTKSSHAKLIAYLEENGLTNESKIVISHAQNLEGALTIKNKLEENYLVDNIQIFDIGPTIGSYSDIGAIAIFMIP